MSLDMNDKGSRSSSDSTKVNTVQDSNVSTNSVSRRRRQSKAINSHMAQGEAWVWLTGGALSLAIFMILGLLGIVLYNGSVTFWPGPVYAFQDHDGQPYMGEMFRQERFTPSETLLNNLPDAQRNVVQAKLDEDDGLANRILLRTANFDLTGTHFTWLNEFDIERDQEAQPTWAIVVERMTWGRFYGMPEAFEVGGDIVADTPESVWERFEQYHAEVRRLWHERRSLEIHALGRANRILENARLELRRVALQENPPVTWVAAFDNLNRFRAGGTETEIAEAREALRRVEAEVGRPTDTYMEAVDVFFEEQRMGQALFQEINEQIFALNQEMDQYKIHMGTVDGQQKVLSLAEVVRAYPANQLGFFEKCQVYLSRWWEFLRADPREANSEGGVFPAIFGTVTMTLIMSLLVAPFGVLAALYLREYAKAGLIVSAVRVAVNNLAGVPSIVFGVFGLGFFCYIIGAGIDEIFFQAKLPNPTFGKGGIMWASFTLALLTLPVVIVATEEALAAVPSSMRQGSYACGASKWQTIYRIVLPRAMPGIMTGMILAMARGAGEVAPLMLVGAVKLAPELPIDRVFPFIHPDRSFMHLGFHIYDLGFQSQNSEAAKPMVFTTTLLLILLIATLNIFAIALRSRMRRRFVANQF